MDLAENHYARAYGLTGIMGSGKSTAAAMLVEKGAVVIDADQLAREVLTEAYPGHAEIHQQIRATFGEQLYAGAGLDRKQLASIVFADKQQLERLNQITHPHVRLLFGDRVAAVSHESVLIYDVPLLFESAMEKQLKKTIVVYCPESLAIDRAVERTGLRREDVIARVQNQISIEKKRKLADYILDNSLSREHLQAQVDSLWRELS